MFSYILDTQVSIPVSTVRTLHRSIYDVEISVHGLKSVYTRNSETRTVLNYAHTVNKFEVFFKFVQLHFPPISSCVGEHSNDTSFFPFFKSRTFYKEGITLLYRLTPANVRGTKLYLISGLMHIICFTNEVT